MSDNAVPYKTPLREVVSDEYELYTRSTCIKVLNWSSENTNDDGLPIGPLTCDCGGSVRVVAWGSYVYCSECAKAMQDVTGMLMSGEYKIAPLNLDRVKIPEDGSVWVILNYSGV